MRRGSCDRAIARGPNEASVSLLSFKSTDSTSLRSPTEAANNVATVSPMLRCERRRRVLCACFLTIMKARGLSPCDRQAEINLLRGEFAVATVRLSNPLSATVCKSPKESSEESIDQSLSSSGPSSHTMLADDTAADGAIDVATDVNADITADGVLGDLTNWKEFLR